jgi:hypothetical protein
MPVQKKSSCGDPSRQPSVVEISDDDEDSIRLEGDKATESAESSESELS